MPESVLDNSDIKRSVSIARGSFSTRLKVSLFTITWSSSPWPRRRNDKLGTAVNTHVWWYSCLHGSVGLRRRRRCQSVALCSGSLPLAVCQRWRLRQEEERVRREDRYVLQDPELLSLSSAGWCQLHQGAATLPSAVGWWRWSSTRKQQSTCSGSSTSGPPVDMIGRTDPPVHTRERSNAGVTITKQLSTRKSPAAFVRLETEPWHSGRVQPPGWSKQMFVSYNGAPSCNSAPFRISGKQSGPPQHRRRSTSFLGWVWPHSDGDAPQWKMHVQGKHKMPHELTHGLSWVSTGRLILLGWRQLEDFVVTSSRNTGSKCRLACPKDKFHCQLGLHFITTTSSHRAATLETHVAPLTPQQTA